MLIFRVCTDLLQERKARAFSAGAIPAPAFIPPLRYGDTGSVRAIWLSFLFVGIV